MSSSPCFTIALSLDDQVSYGPPAVRASRDIANTASKSMKSKKYNRRKFLGTVTASAAGGILADAISPLSTANAQTNSFLAQASSLPSSQKTSEYLFADGLTYLNTGTLGPCRRDTVAEATTEWESLESLPVRFYGLFGA